MATQFTLGPLTVSGANTATQISATRISCHHFVIQVSSDNTDVVWIGDSRITPAGGGLLLQVPVAGATLPYVGVPSVEGAPNNFNLQDWYFCSPTAGQKINLIYVQG